MGGSPVLAGWDTFVLAVPILGLLAMVMFGLDEWCSSPRTRQGSRRFFCEVDGSGRGLLTDPDGRPWQKRGVRHIEARMIRVSGQHPAELWPDHHAHPAVIPAIRGYVIENE